MVELDRRNVLKGIGGIGATAAVGGLGFLAVSGGATATAGSTIDDPNAVTSDDGEVTYVAVQTTGRVEWDGFDTAAKKARMISQVRYKRNGNVLGEWTIHDTSKFDLGSSWGGSGEDISLTGDHESGQSGHIASDVDWGIAQKNRNNTYNNGYGLPNNPAPVNDLYAGADGSTRETKVVLETQYRLYDAGGGELTGTNGYPDRPVGESRFVVEVNNQGSSTTQGDADGEGDTGDSAEVGV